MCPKDAGDGGLKAHIYAFNFNFNSNMTKTVRYHSLWLKKQGSWTGEPPHEQN
jgi:hypothetical protein